MYYTFHKSERLCSLRLITQLFAKGNPSIARFPFRFTWVAATLDSAAPVQVVFVVPKRKFQRANARNAIKRHMRELYRLNKPAFYQTLPAEKQFALAIIYSGNTHLSYQELQKSFTALIKQLAHEMAKLG
jgi:ribonuclease P protein component